MTIGERIKQRRIQLKISQEDLAFDCGYAERSAISKIENCGTDIPQSKMPLFAKALNTSVEYLMGLDSDDEETAELLENVRQNPAAVAARSPSGRTAAESEYEKDRLAFPSGFLFFNCGEKLLS